MSKVSQGINHLKEIIMKRIISITAIVAFALTSCEKIETDNNLQENSINSTLDINASRSIRPVILGNQKQNPFSLENMKIALDTLKGIVEQSDQEVIKSKSMEEVELEATDLYVRFLPEDSTQFQKLINDTTLVLYDYPLDYEILQTGDYYLDTAVNNGFTWYYSVVKPGFQPPDGISYELIEELFIPENSEYYSVEDVGLSSKSTQSANRRVSPSGNNILSALYIVSFTLTGNEKELQPFNTTSPQFHDDDKDSPIQKSTINNCTVHRIKILGKVYSWTTCDPYYQPDGFIRIETPTGDVGVKGVIVRMRRWFTSVDARTTSSGYYSTSERFNSILTGNNISYKLVFDGKNMNNRWTLNRTIMGSVDLWTNTQDLGSHSPSGRTVTIRVSSGAWGRSVLSNAISDYCDIARIDGVALPPENLVVANRETDKQKSLFPRLKDRWLLPDLMLYHAAGINNYNKIVANTLHELIFTSLFSSLLAEKGKSWTDTYWNEVYEQLKFDEDNDLIDCSCVTTKETVTDYSQQVVLCEAWANYRKEELIRKHLNIDPISHVTQNPYLIQYIDAFKALRAKGCQLGILEKAICTKTIDGFKANLLASNPYLSETIASIKNPTQKDPNKITIMSYNFWLISDYDKFIRIIACANPDLVAIQEIRDRSQFEDLKEGTSLKGAMYNTFNYKTYGIGLLYKSALGNPKISTYELKTPDNSNDEDPSRAYILAEFSNFCFISTHFSTDQNDRSRMTDSIISYAKRIGKPVFLAGDLNEQPYDPNITKFKNHGFVLLNDPNTLTYSTKHPSLTKTLDLILGYKNNSINYTIVSRGVALFPKESLKELSDHLPYCVTLNL